MTLCLVRPTILALCLAAFIGVNLANFISPLPVIVQLTVSSVSLTIAGVILKVPLRRKSDGGYSSNQTQQIITKSDAMQFPLIASAMLFTLYIIFKFIPKQYVSVVISTIFALLSIGVIASLSSQILQLLVKLNQKTTRPIYTANIGKVGKYILDTEQLVITPLKLGVMPIAVLLVSYFVYSRDWWMNNIIGACLTIHSIGSLPLGSVKIGLLLLWGLFIYDVFWVFGTDVMVTVAKNLNIPALLKFPLPNPTQDKKFSMLGLGDMVMPGIFIVVSLKIDIQENIKNKVKLIQNFNLPFFSSAAIGYLIGIITTGAVMLIYQAAQPALLYLVPALTISFFVCALQQGRLTQALNWQQKPNEEGVQKQNEMKEMNDKKE